MEFPIKSTVKRMLAKSKPEEKNKLWSLIQNNYDLGMEIRRPFEEIWQLNMSFLVGRQYVFFNRSASILQQIMLRKGRVRAVDNKLLPRFRKQVSRLIRNNPIVTVVPNSTDQEDVEAAKVGTKVLAAFQKNNKMRRKLLVLAGWIYATGNAFMDDRWNPKLGKEEIDPESGEVVYEGDADVGIWSPFEVLVPSIGVGDESLHDLDWMMKIKFRSLGSIATSYKGNGAQVRAESRPIPFIDMGSLFGYSPGASSQRIEGAVVKELYVKPCAAYPKGLFVTGANGVVLNQQDYPFNFYHMEQFKDVEIPGVFWGMATLEAGIWLQKIQNRTVSDVAEFNRTMARGKYMAPKKAQLETKIDDSMGQILTYNPVMGLKPEQMQIASLPRTYELSLQFVAQGLMELFYQHEVTQGTNKSDIRSGEMVSLLLEQDDFGNIPTHAVFEESFEAVMGRVLRRMQKGYSTERAVKLIGKEGEWDVFSFKGADLRGNTDVSVKKESSLPDSRIGRQNQILGRFEKGLYGDPADPEVRRHVMQMLDDAMVEDIYSEMRLDEINAKLESRAMMAQPGTLLMINHYDDHRVHIKVHRLERKGRNYQRIRERNTKLFLTLEASYQAHEDAHMRFVQEQEKAMEEKVVRMEQFKKGGAKNG